MQPSGSELSTNETSRCDGFLASLEPAPSSTPPPLYSMSAQTDYSSPPPLIPSVAQNISLPYSPVVYVPITLPGQPTVTLPGQQTPSYIYDTHCSLSFHIIFVKEIFQGAQDAEFVIYVLKMESHIPLLTIYACSIKSMLYSQILVLVVTKCHQT